MFYFRGIFWWKKIEKIEEKCWKNPIKEKNEKENSPKFGFSPVHQMSLDSPLSWTLIAVQKNGKLTAGLSAGLTAGLTAGLPAGLTAGLTAVLTAVLMVIIVVILGVPY